MVQDFGEMDAPNPDNGGQILDGSLEGVVVLRHDSIVVSHTILSRGNAIESGRGARTQMGPCALIPEAKILEHGNASLDAFLAALSMKP